MCGTAASLGGRAARLSLYGLSQGEIRGIHDDFAALVTTDPAVLTATRTTLDRAAYTDVDQVADQIRQTVRNYE